jgi:hypothetical protein
MWWKVPVHYGRLKPFGNLFGAASRVVLQAFSSLEPIAAMPFDELVEMIEYHHISPPHTFRQAILAVSLLP